MVNDLAKAMRSAAWTSFVSCQLGFARHPGARREGGVPQTLEEIYETADAALREHDERFGEEV